jgi:hypothetical protein
MPNSFGETGIMVLRIRPLLIISAVLALLVPLAAPAFAGPKEIEYLQSYVGSWKGSGEVKGGEDAEKFSCRVNVTPGNGGKINYAGRCAVSGLNLSVAGTIAYIDARNRYEAAMTSNATFSGTAVGRKQGGGIVFDLKERNTDKEGNDMTIQSQVSLLNNAIGLKFTVIFNDSGDRSNASVTFARM